MVTANALHRHSDEGQQMTQINGLGEFVVLDFSESIAGQYCARLLADLGARVILIEPPEGSWIRRRGPYRKDVARPNDSFLFFHLNSAKESVTLNYSSPSGEEFVPPLLQLADVAILPDAGPLHTTITRHARTLPRLVTCRIDDFEDGSDYGDWLGDEMLFQALAGVMYENGRPDREPLYGCGYRSIYGTGVMAAAAVLAALWERETSHQGQEASAVASTVAASMNFSRGTQYWYNGSAGR
jgi:crotonobetainyl-CoA:carnitine CoA-transferase CaiB-like acyl-CoA transferase